MTLIQKEQPNNFVKNILTQKNNRCQYGEVDSQPFYCTLFVLKMAPAEGRKVRSMFLTSCLAVIFGLKVIGIF